MAVPRVDLLCRARVRAPSFTRIPQAMTVSEARSEYRQLMSRMDVAFAFGHGYSISGSHPKLCALRAEADRLLAQPRTLEAAAGERALNTPGRKVTIEYSRQ